jgi:hypothetical protein
MSYWALLKGPRARIHDESLNPRLDLLKTFNAKSPVFSGGLVKR